MVAWIMITLVIRLEPKTDLKAVIRYIVNVFNPIEANMYFC